MLKPLIRAKKKELYWFKDGKKTFGKHLGLRGDCSGLRGDCSGLRGDCTDLRGNCSGLWGNCSGLWGNCSGLRGNCTGLWGNCTDLWGNCSGLRGNCTDLRGNLSEIPLKERKKYFNLNSWVKEKDGMTFISVDGTAYVNVEDMDKNLEEIRKILKTLKEEK